VAARVVWRTSALQRRSSITGTDEFRCRLNQSIFLNNLFFFGLFVFECRIAFDRVAGTSQGACIGAMLACGWGEALYDHQPTAAPSVASSAASSPPATAAATAGGTPVAPSAPASVHQHASRARTPGLALAAHGPTPVAAPAESAVVTDLAADVAAEPQVDDAYFYDGVAESDSLFAAAASVNGDVAVLAADGRPDVFCVLPPADAAVTDAATAAASASEGAGVGSAGSSTAASAAPSQRPLSSGGFVRALSDIGNGIDHGLASASAPTLSDFLSLQSPSSVSSLSSTASAASAARPRSRLLSRVAAVPMGSALARAGAPVAGDAPPGRVLRLLPRRRFRYSGHGGSALEASFREFGQVLGSLRGLLADATLPLVSYFAGARFGDNLKVVLSGNADVEDAWVPFCAVSVNLSTSELTVHTRVRSFFAFLFQTCFAIDAPLIFTRFILRNSAQGPLWRAVRASMSLLEYLPPLQDPLTGDLLADGGYVDNLPVTPLHHLAWPSALPPLFTVAVDVENKSVDELTPLPYYGEYLDGFWLWGKRVQQVALAPWLRHLIPAFAHAAADTAGSSDADKQQQQRARALEPWCDQGPGGMRSFFAALFDFSTVAAPDAAIYAGPRAAILPPASNSISSASPPGSGAAALALVTPRIPFKFPRFGELIAALKFLPHTIRVRDTLALPAGVAAAATIAAPPAGAAALTNALVAPASGAEGRLSIEVTAPSAAASGPAPASSPLIDLYIRPQGIEQYKILDYDKWHEITAVGYARAEPLCALFLHKYGRYFTAY
jgi:predicted acylesterase/phospholipase RssA